MPNFQSANFGPAFTLSLALFANKLLYRPRLRSRGRGPTGPIHGMARSSPAIYVTTHPGDVFGHEVQRRLTTRRNFKARETPSFERDREPHYRYTRTNEDGRFQRAV